MDTKTQTIAFIPARIGSRSIPKKNIKLFLGKPLIYWVINAAENCSEIDQVVLSIDSKEIEEAIAEFSFHKLKIHYRSAETATDEASTESVILDYLAMINHNKHDLFLLLQATSPLTTSNDISEAISLYHQGGFDSVLSCVRSKHFFWSETGKALNYDIFERPRRQDFSGTLQENGAMYISSINKIWNSKNRISGRIGIYEMTAATAYEIDDSDDWVIAEGLKLNMLRTV